MARVELNKQDLEGIVGGAFNFQYNSKGEYCCRVDGVGSFYAKEGAKRAIAIYDAENPGQGDAALAEWAMENGWLWQP